MSEVVTAVPLVKGKRLVEIALAALGMDVGALPLLVVQGAQHDDPAGVERS